MGAFGLNASILDAANLSWKLGFAAKGLGKIDSLLPTYNSERRKHAARIIKVSGEYLRWICGSPLAVADLSDIEALEKADRGEAPQSHVVQQVIDGKPNGVNGHNAAPTNEDGSNGSQPPLNRELIRAKDFKFIEKFFRENGKFLLGVDCPYDESVIAPTTSENRAVSVKNGVRAPNPRVCFSATRTGYLYDKLAGPARLHLVVFGSSLAGSEVRRQLAKFTKSLEDPSGFYQRFGGSKVFNVVLVAKLLPFEYEEVAAKDRELLGPLERIGATVVFDDRVPDEDAHYTWGVNHQKGAVAVVRPDLWHGMSCFPEETEKLNEYFSAFLQEA
jgi:phenol 2-monooxygenase